jgi:O-antigen ligase
MANANSLPLGESTEGQAAVPSRLIRAKQVYFLAMVAFSLATVLAGFVQTRGQLLTSFATWLFIIPFVLGLLNIRVGLLSATLLLTISPALPLQVSFFTEGRFFAWSHPGVDAVLGFLVAWLIRSRPILSLQAVFHRFPSGALILLHAWLAASSVLAVFRNIWQSGSEIVLSGLFINVRLLRAINWNHDYFPLQDLFSHSIALWLVFAVWSLLLSDGMRLSTRLIVALLAGAAINAGFAIWQELTGGGWIADRIDGSVNAFWPDLHSFGALMTVGTLIGVASYKTARTGSALRIFAIVTASLSLIGLLLSTSRIPVFVLALLAAGWGVWNFRRQTGWRRAGALIFFAAIVLFVHALLLHGYRGFSYDSLSPLLKGFHAGNWNAMLGYRPEIWMAAVRMYLEFPAFGLGQGTFYRLSAIHSFAGSELLFQLGGEHAHNYFLQSFVELGPIGASLALLSLLPVLFRVGRKNIMSVALLGLGGVAIGNVYAHSLLIREMLLITATLFAVYLREAEVLRPDSVLAPSTSIERSIKLGLFALVILAIADVVTSFQRFPFSYGQRCYEQRQWNDGWVSGLLRQPVPEGATRVELGLSWPRRDLEHRELAINVSIAAPDGEVLDNVVLKPKGPEDGLTQVVLDVQQVQNAARILEIRASNCYVPFNLGHSADARTLAMHVPLVQFVDDSGTIIPAPK